MWGAAEVRGISYDPVSSVPSAQSQDLQAGSQDIYAVSGNLELLFLRPAMRHSPSTRLGLKIWDDLGLPQRNSSDSISRASKIMKPDPNATQIAKKLTLKACRNQLMRQVAVCNTSNTKSSILETQPPIFKPENHQKKKPPRSSQGFLRRQSEASKHAK